MATRRRSSIVNSLNPAQSELVSAMMDEAGLLQDRVLTYKGLEDAAADALARMPKLADTLNRHAGQTHPVRQNLLDDVKFIANTAQREAEFGIPEHKRTAARNAALCGMVALPDCTINWAADAARIALAAHVLTQGLPAEEADEVFAKAKAELKQMSRDMPHNALGSTRRL